MDRHRMDLLHSISEPVIALTSHFIVVDVNPSAERFFKDKKSSELVGQRLSTTLLKTIMHPLLNVISNERLSFHSQFDVVQARLSKQLFSWSVLPARNDQASFTGMVLFGRELNGERSTLSLRSEVASLSQKLTGQSLNQARSTLDYVKHVYAYMETIVSEIPASIYWMNKACVYLGCNNAMAKLFGLSSRHDIVGKRYNDLYDEKSAAAYRKADTEVMSTGIPKKLEEPLYYPDGRKETYLSSKVPLRDDSGNIVGMLGVSINITEQKQLESQLNIAKKKAEASNAAKSEFIANMSHDIRTPITGMLGMLQDLLNTANEVQTASNDTTVVNKLVHTVQHHSEFLLSATDELLQLCNEILEVIQLGSGQSEEQIESFDVRELMQHNDELLQPVAHHKPLALSVSVDARVPTFLKGLRRYLDRTVLNLMSNALKFTPTGWIRVTVDLAEAPSRVPQRDDTVMLRFVIEDSGMGIPADKFGVIFEHFSRLTPSYEGQYKGSGLGLYTVKQYVNAMGGQVTVRSEVGSGSCFTVIVPLLVSDHADQRKTASAPLSASSTPPSSALTVKGMSPSEAAVATVLVVEDNTVAAMAVVLLLKRLHCAVELAENGAQALEKACQGTYDLILMDVGLPDFSGIEATRRIRQLPDGVKSRVPIVALTGHAENAEQRQECLAAGMQEVLAKPAQPLLVESILEQWVFCNRL